MPGRLIQPFRIGIIGGGLTGVLAAIELSRAASSSIIITIIENSHALGKGVAYSTDFVGHLLNVCASNMSLFSDTPDDFLQWLRDHATTDLYLDDFNGDLPWFVPRAVYGNYITARLAAEKSTAINWCNNTAIGLKRLGAEFRIELDQGAPLFCNAVIYCGGNFAPVWPAAAAVVAKDPAAIVDPWVVPSFYDKISPHDRVVILGTGLTAIDIVLRLKHQGHQAPIIALSRHGIMPQAHRATPIDSDLPIKQYLPPRILDLFRLMRAEITAGIAAGDDWRAIFDTWRPYHQKLWQSLPLEERRRFLRHVRAYWDSHRHRLAPQLAEKLTIWQQNHEFQPLAGRVHSAERHSNVLSLTYIRRGSTTLSTITADWLINGTGPLSDFAKSDAALITQMMADGLCQPDPLGLGLQSNSEDCMLDSSGVAQKSLFLLGPPSRPYYWEISSVPEIREQCRHFAQILFKKINVGALT